MIPTCDAFLAVQCELMASSMLYPSKLLATSSALTTRMRADLEDSTLIRSLTGNAQWDESPSAARLATHIGTQENCASLLHAACA
jgi:hypothetical protein